MTEPCETADGTLVVMVCRARHLPNRRKLDKQSPYALLRINAVAHKTPAHFRAGQTPEWTHEMRFQLSRDRKAVMRLDVLDETKADPTPIGGADIDCARVFQNPANLQESGKYILDGWYDLAFKDRYAGKIFLEMTFYPSAPMPPPKLGHAAPEPKLLPVLPPEPPLTENVFVAPQHADTPAHVHATTPSQDVFVDGLRPKSSRFAKLKDKFLAKEPISGLWTHEDKHGAHRHSHSEPINAPPPALDSFEALLLEMGISPASEPQAQGAPLPPPPPPHSASGSTSSDPRLLLYGGRLSHTRSPERCPHTDTAPSLSPQKHRRKPPPALEEPASMAPLDSTSIPFSADNFQLDADPYDLLPTKVYHMDKPVKSLTVLAAGRDKHALNPNEIDPQFYAPTPSEHLSKSSQHQSSYLQSPPKRFDEREMRDSGYLGEGSWNVPKDSPGRFSPSVFQRMNAEVDSEENKPRVPPKIPNGLSESEYYVLDKDNYFKDINGRRF